MARSGARPGDWQAHPFAGPTGSLAFKRRFTADQMRRLQQGLVPEQMEDKWFIVWHDDALWLHRSWTGQCIYRVCFAPDGDGFAVADVQVPRDPQVASTADGFAENMLGVMLDAVLRYSRSA